MGNEILLPMSSDEGWGWWDYKAIFTTIMLIIAKKPLTKGSFRAIISSYRILIINNRKALP